MGTQTNRSSLFVLAITFLVLLVNAGSAQTSKTEGNGRLAKFIVIADVHFDPFYNEKLVSRLSAEAPGEWPAILASATPGLNPYGTDTNYELLESTLADARAREPNPDFILYAGDFLAHYWRARFKEFSNDKSEAAYRAFTSKIMQFLADRFTRYFPNVPVLPTLGNVDSYCGDYQIQPRGAFLRMFKETWSSLLGPVAHSETDFDEVFPKGGYFSMPLPRLKKHRLIVLNTVLFSTNYTNRCGDPSEKPGMDQLQWLRLTLEKAQHAGESVWLLMHIPFGIDVFNTLLRGTAAAPVTFWRPAYSRPFLELMRRYRSRVQALFSGHIHMDTFRIFARAEDRAILFNHVAPAISPIFGNNPGYQLFSYRRDTGELEDYTTFYLTNLTDAKRSRRGIWKREYEFNRSYGLTGINRVTLRRLSREVASNPQVQRKYTRYYNVSRTRKPVISRENMKAYRCALANLTPSSFERCSRSKGH
jgi:sphingomyelin phosphodiesterase acid-like 3